MSDIHTIDTHYLDRPEVAAAYLIVEGDRAAFVDNNTNAAVPRLLAALEDQGLTPEQVDYLIITHVHLDHAGGTSKLARACPNATVLAHPRAAPHVIDPSKLVASASAVYGEDEFERLYGTIEPVDEDRVQVMEDEQTLRFGNRELRFLHARGHANHHFCIADSASGAIFAGDAFGLVYPALQGEGTFAFPSTSPTDFEPELARESIRRLVDEQPSCIYVTHFGAVTDIAEAAGQLTRHLDFAERVRDDAEASDLPDEELEAYCRPRLYDYVAGLLDGRGNLGRNASVWSHLKLDLDINAQGIAFAANKRRRKARAAGG
ncbi:MULTISPECIES: MBL fold metallo-hydrolase [unclassified Wenzhouxiangella]|uniref:MBL fold metallo-hydrolase n=1 Tax=unclassified Wenzhouxiangella TaxID=2613841 RepID=UPI000E32787B|nr:MULTISPECIES: MBL fold metallo-hydrolase [unclassified Wenzhouxiangella]RFF26715.1 MBL fold metallo-hydrolase [Wenzhouxiangella sp. 15181]RFP69315.1 MBL fold metallo-hydrolase [Wenzhouxiangella sp. 15190]